MINLTQSELENLLRVPASRISWEGLSPFLDTSALAIDVLEPHEIEAVRELLANHISHDSQRVGTRSREEVWNSGWRENLKAYRSSGSWMALQPRYYTSSHHLRSPVSHLPLYRVGGRFVVSHRVDFEVHLAEANRSLVFNFLSENLDPPVVVEIGCGTGLNILALSRFFPEARILASDYVSSALECTELVCQRNDIRSEVLMFDMCNPSDLPLPDGSLVVTMGAIEQVGTAGADALFDWILRQSGVYFFHSEPFIEMYTGEYPGEDLLTSFAEKRGYTRGLLPRIRDAHARGLLRDFQEQRVAVGTALLEGYNRVLYCVD